MSWDFSTGVGVNLSFSRRMLEFVCARTMIAPFFRPMRRQGPVLLPPDSQIMVSMEVQRLEDFEEFDPNKGEHRMLYRALAEYLDKTAASVFLMNPYPKVLLASDNFYGQRSQIPPYDDAGWYVGMAASQDLDILMERGSCQRWQQYLKQADFIFKGEECMIYNTRWIGINYGWWREPVVFGGDTLFSVEYALPTLRCMQNMPLNTKQIGVYGGLFYQGEPSKIIHLRNIKNRKQIRAESFQQIQAVDLPRRKINWR